jgi:hypothetical protein
MALDKERVSAIINQHRSALSALGHWDSCEWCQGEDYEVSTCPELARILGETSD